ncbi:hypothetical protein [Deinococcus sp. QL22]|uniref:hypothetical protein n=1 Tax=Deinococcus sp. QL22 TaxID=2939437 RepID=UPI002017098D|nr:hypothetical protein [Deinococcus sp. QL22]UQN08628.1 hypothetical protein M1R55_21100 [Deinococcus sp. QL22]
MNSHEDVLLRAHRLLAESVELGRQCAEFYEREHKPDGLMDEATAHAALFVAQLATE